MKRRQREPLVYFNWSIFYATESPTVDLVKNQKMTPFKQNLVQPYECCFLESFATLEFHRTVDKAAKRKLELHQDCKLLMKVDPNWSVAARGAHLHLLRKKVLGIRFNTKRNLWRPQFAFSICWIIFFQTNLWWRILTVPLSCRILLCGPNCFWQLLFCQPELIFSTDSLSHASTSDAVEWHHLSYQG